MQTLKDGFFFLADISSSTVSWFVKFVSGIFPFMTPLVQRSLFGALGFIGVVGSLFVVVPQEDQMSLFIIGATPVFLFIALGFIVHPLEDLLPPFDEEHYLLRAVRSLGYWMFFIYVGMSIGEIIKADATLEQEQILSFVLMGCGYLLLMAFITPTKTPHTSLFTETEEES